MIKKNFTHNFVAVYRVEGIAPIDTQTKDILIFEDLKTGVRVLQTADYGLYCQEINQSLAIKSLLLRGLFADDSLTINQRVESEIEKMNSLRSEYKTSGGYIVIEVSTPTSLESSELLYKETEKFDFCLDAKLTNEAIKLKERTINSVLAGIQSASASVSKFEKIRSGVYLKDSSDKLCFCAEVKVGSVRGIVSCPLEKNLNSIKFAISGLLKNEKLDRSISFYLQSIDLKSDNLKSFLFSWTALEVLIHKIYPNYESKSKWEALINRIWKKTKNAGPKPKFEIIARATQSGEQAEKDIIQFGKIYKLRNDIVHGNVVFDEEFLRLGTCQALYEKYLKFHLGLN